MAGDHAHPDLPSGFLLAGIRLGFNTQNTLNTIQSLSNNALKKYMSETPLRIVTGLLLLATALLVIWAGGMVFTVFMILVFIALAYEATLLFNHIARKATLRWLSRISLAVALGLYLVPAIVAALLMRDNIHGLAAILWIGVTVSAADTGAYITGRTLKGPKLWPAVSPGKTWSGLAGGLLSGGAISALCLSDPASGFLLGVVLAFAGQSGDLIESFLKRQAGVKDSGRILPGHGGVLDRFDGFLVATPVAWLMLEFYLLTGYTTDQAGPFHAFFSLIP